MGIPTWRSLVMYIPQRTAVMEGTPLDFVEVIRKFQTHKNNTDYYDDPVQVALDWGVRPDLWHSKWNTLSGGEIQRIALAIGCSFRPEVLLLDEPTSALDEESCDKVEETLRGLNCIWVTHNPHQAKRISSAGTLQMREGDNSEPGSPLSVTIESNRDHGDGHVKPNGSKHNKASGHSKSSSNASSSSSSSSKTAGAH
ncbi:P-loop containing nucleoside triphosphate hydrolase protein [Lobosporangium transversale]|nr:P-loop containing nucleoside triphosphate hydrolase protein [Lobosporangium transversale]ORZ11710.1 P-loop containing nucleoside triphosphate hydrolase protein [Lobosporangium transversale]|eukprot:XP_021879807.1 P-loop containing nucleoside triphosphate hydrolase protein [Lobosporangium transversale]